MLRLLLVCLVSLNAVGFLSAFSLTGGFLPPLIARRTTLVPRRRPFARPFLELHSRLSAVDGDGDGGDNGYSALSQQRTISIQPNAVERLEELKRKKAKTDKTTLQDTKLTLRLAVKSGGCSGLSYDIQFINESETGENDVVEMYDDLLEGLRCVVDPKSLLYLYGLSLDYSDALVGGGFQFNNPNAKTDCGCGKSFGV